LTKSELHWLAGLLEGEGCFTTGGGERPAAYVKLAMTDLDVVARAAGLMGISTDQIRERPRHPTHQTCYEISIGGTRALKLMKKVYPLMGIRRRQRIEELLERFEKRR
jgi:hypothetical protein